MLRRILRRLVPSGGRQAIVRIFPWLRVPYSTRDHLAEYIRRYNYEVGQYTYGRPRIETQGGGARVIIGDFCSIGPGVTILLDANHRYDFVSTYPFQALPGLWPDLAGPNAHSQARGDVVIGSDVWICYGVTILSGVTIGHGAVLGAGTVVSRDIPPYAVVAGNPARIERMRFDDETIKALVESRWWELDRERILQLVPLISSTQVAEFIDACRTIRSHG